jgi:hypothetical protein
VLAGQEDQMLQLNSDKGIEEALDSFRISVSFYDYQENYPTLNFSSTFDCMYREGKCSGLVSSGVRICGYT